jgi:hypothetical protein
MNRSFILPARVAAKNRANANAMALYDAFTKALAPFVGQKITKANGDLLAKVVDALPSLSFFHYRDSSQYSLRYVAKESQNLGDGIGCVYEETSVYIGDLVNGVLVKLYDRPVIRTDYNENEIKLLRKLAEDARDEARKAESALGSFGLYDR